MKQTLFKTLLIAATMLGASNTVNADCSVTTDSYGKTQVVWDFGVTATNITGGGSYYLNASTNAYVASSEAATSYTATSSTDRTKWVVAHVYITGGTGRSIYASSTPDSDKGAGVAMGKSQGYINFWAPISGTVALGITTGSNNKSYLNRFSIVDKTTSSDSYAVASDGSCSIPIVKGHRYQITASDGAGLTTITLTPEGYGTDNVESGTQDFTSNVLLSGTTLPTAEKFYCVSSTGYKEITKVDDVKDMLVVYNKVANDGTFDITSESETSYTGLKIAGGNNSYYNYTSSKNGTLTITYAYGGDRGTAESKTANSYYNQVSRANGSWVVKVGAGQRVQVWGFSEGVYIKSISFEEKSSVAATIASVGWGTLYTAWPLDFSTTGLTAYTASVADNTVTLTAVTSVPANTGVVLKGAEGSVDIPVTSYSSTAQGVLTGSTSDLASSSFESGYTYYVLIPVNEGSQVQFNPVTSGTIAAGKAYLKIASGVSGVKALSVVFNEQTTDINAVGQTNASHPDDGIVYTLSGQRAKAVTKGIFIKNGRKFIAK